VTASVDLDWNPTYKGSIRFEPTVGISDLKIEHTSTLSTQATLSTQGIYTWLDSSVFSHPLSDPKETMILVALGPIPIPISLSVTSTLKVQSNSLTIEGNNQIQLSYQDLKIRETLDYMPQDPSTWIRQGVAEGRQATVSVRNQPQVTGLLDFWLQQDITLQVLNAPKTQSQIDIAITEGGYLEKAEVTRSQGFSSELRGNQTLFVISAVNYSENENGILESVNFLQKDACVTPATLSSLDDLYRRACNCAVGGKEPESCIQEIEQTGRLPPEQRDAVIKGLEAAKQKVPNPKPCPVPLPPIPNPEPKPTKPGQTCENEVLEQLTIQKNEVCGSIPPPNCREALDKLKKGKSLKGASAKATRAKINAKIPVIDACIAKREEIQEVCFKGAPEPGHDNEINELNRAKKSCQDLLTFANSLTPEQQQKLLPPNW
jgi:hypothetical protein